MTVLSITVFRSYSDSLRAGESGVRIPVEEEFSGPSQTSPEVHPDSCAKVTAFFLRDVELPGRGDDYPRLPNAGSSVPAWQATGQPLPNI
jgi:hypothetical protein